LSNKQQPVLSKDTYQELLKDRYYGQAMKDDPEGLFCGQCGCVNVHYDDCGWWYGYLEGRPKQEEFYVPLCTTCAPPHYGER
jgi:hypothetical protein